MKAGIVGMGIMGRLLAFALHHAGWQVTLFDQTSGNDNCSMAAAGLLTPYSELDKAELLIFHLGRNAIRTAWPFILQKMTVPIYFKQYGSIILNHPHDQTEWDHFHRHLSSRLDFEDIYFQQLNQDTLMQLEPGLAKFERAYYFPGEAQIDCQSLMSAIKSDLVAAGVPCYMQTPVLSLKPGLIVTQSNLHRFDMVFDCRGLGAGDVFADLRALRGELIWLHAPDVQLQRPIRLLHPRYRLYIVPRPGNIYLIGASEIEAEDYSEISVRTSLELLTAAYYVHAGFAEARILKTVTHCRPTLANHLPRIQYTDGLISVNGLYRHGYLIAPALVEEILYAIKTRYQHMHYPEIWEQIS